MHQRYLHMLRPWHQSLHNAKYLHVSPTDSKYNDYENHVMNRVTVCFSTSSYTHACRMSMLQFQSGGSIVTRWILLCLKRVLTTARPISVAISSSLSPSSFVLACKLYLPIVDLNDSSRPNRVLKRPIINMASLLGHFLYASFSSL